MRFGSSKLTSMLAGAVSSLGFTSTARKIKEREQLANQEAKAVPPEQRQRGGKKNSGGSFRGRRRRANYLPGYLGHLRGQNATRARLDSIYASMREGVRIARERREDYLFARKQRRELSPA